MTFSKELAQGKRKQLYSGFEHLPPDPFHIVPSVLALIIKKKYAGIYNIDIATKYEVFTI